MSEQTKEEVAPLPPVPENINIIVDLLGISSAEADYLKVSYLHETVKAQADLQAATELLVGKTRAVREYLNALVRKDDRRVVTDRLSGLQLAFAQMRCFFGDQELRMQPDFMRAARNMANGTLTGGNFGDSPLSLVDRMTVLATDFRIQSGYTTAGV